jgi:Na+/proline symporter
VYLAFVIGDLAGGPGPVISHAASADKLAFLPALDAKDMLAFFAAWLTAAIGSIPQQDIFQRVTSAKDEQTAVRGTLIGAVAYFCFAFVPIFLAYSALIIDPTMVEPLLATEGTEFQLILPTLILNHTPLFAQVMFFGALLSAILSTASGALLAPTALFTENILKHFVPHLGDRQFLLTLRLVLVIFTLAVMLFALNSEASIYQMVQNTYKVTLVSCLVPLAAGIYWKRSTSQGAILSMALGIISWVGLELFAPDGLWPPQLVGFGFAIIGMWLGSIASPSPHVHQRH